MRVMPALAVKPKLASWPKEKLRAPRVLEVARLAAELHKETRAANDETASDRGYITADRMSVLQHFKRWRGRLGRGGEASPESNPYAYGRNNPLRYTDPTGKVAVADDVIIIGGTVLVGACIASPGCRDALSAGAKACGQLIDQTITGLGNLIFNEGDKDASTPTGRRGNPIEVEPGTNEPTNIGGRDYTGHALDRMQGRGVPPSAVEDAIQNGQPSSGNQPGTTVHTGSNGVTVVVGSGGQVVTVITK